MSFAGYLILATILLFMLSQATSNDTIAIIAWTLVVSEVIFVFFKSR